LARIKYEPVSCYHCGKMINDPIEYVKKPLPLSSKGGLKMVDRDLHNECAIDLAKRMEYQIDVEKEYDDFDKAYRLFKRWYGLDPDNKEHQLDKYTIMRLKGLRVGNFFSTGQNVQYLKKGYESDVIYKTMVYVSSKVELALRGKIKEKPRNNQTNYIMAIILNNINFIQGRVDAAKRAEKALEQVDVSLSDEKETVYVKKHEKSELQSAFEKVYESIEEEKGEEDFFDIF